jgi:hypothetical protein
MCCLSIYQESKTPRHQKETCFGEHCYSWLTVRMASTETQEFTSKTQRNWSTQAFGMCFSCGEVHHPHQMEGDIVDPHMRWSWYSQNLPPHNTSIYQVTPGFHGSSGEWLCYNHSHGYGWQQPYSLYCSLKTISMWLQRELHKNT